MTAPTTTPSRLVRDLAEAAHVAGLESINGGDGCWPPGADSDDTWASACRPGHESDGLNSDAPLNAEDLARIANRKTAPHVHLVWPDLRTALTFADLAQATRVRVLTWSAGDQHATDVRTADIPALTAALRTRRTHLQDPAVREGEPVRIDTGEDTHGPTGTPKGRASGHH